MTRQDSWGDVMRLVKSKGNMDVGLKGAEKGKVVTRFPPEPSGFLHIGHAKAALLNDYFARHYEGKLIVRFDDTNTEKATQGFEDSIVQDLERLGIKPDVIEYTSDYFPKLLEVAERLIKEDKAYVDPTPPEEMKAQRLKKEANQYRTQSVEENLRLWQEMLKGTEEGEKCVLRAKFDIRHKNGTLRDPTMYRTKKVPHHRTGSKYNVYPTYDFSCPLVDSWEGVTHALRSLEYKDREKQYQWFCKAADVRCANIWEFSRLDFVRTVLSKRKLQKLVDIGAVRSWDDPRFPTIQGVRRRGMTIQGLRAFILSQGASRNNTTQEWDKIWTVNKRVIDPIAARHVALDIEAAKLVTVINAGDEVRTVPKHKKNPDVGTKNVIYKSKIFIEGEDAASIEVGEKVTFMDWGNMEITDRDGDGNLQAKFLPDDQNFKGTKKVTWLADVEDLVPLRVCSYSDILTKDRLEEDDEFEDFINRNSEKVKMLKGDVNLRLLQKGDTIQLERRGFYICDNAVPPLTLIEIPDGKVARR
ncbi:Glutamyl-tRNA synthetase [Gracilaria domingensis]|nr:Glutamyl-tRNA synthetase [Gracilaria domingensis]